MSGSTDKGGPFGKERVRFILTRAFLVLFGLLLLAGFELGLRLWWNPGDAETTLRVGTAIDPFEASDGWAVTRKEFNGAFRNSRFSEEKPKGIFRIFCLGGSTTFGYPFPPQAAWPSRLGKRLQALYPGKIEVTNAGGNSYGSARTLGVLRGILKYHPDLVVVAIGDAEFVEDSYRTSVAPRSLHSDFLDRLYIVRLMRRAVARSSKKRAVLPVDSLTENKGAGEFLFSPVLHGTVYHPDNETRRRVLAEFEQNIRKIIETCRANGIKIVLCTLPSNISSWPPDPDDGKIPAGVDARQWQRLAAEAGWLDSSQDMPGALEKYRKALELWDGSALLNFRYGRALLMDGQGERAKAYLLRARDLDPSPIRASTAVNSVIRRVAGQMEAPLADLSRVFSSISPSGIVGDNLILDYAHPTEEGHALAERTIWRTLEENVNGWPNYSRELEERISETPVRRYEPQMDADLSFVWGQIYLRKGLLDRAERMFRRAVALGYDGPYALLNLSEILLSTRRAREAIPILEGIIRENPDFQEPYFPLAEAWYSTGNLEKGIRFFRRAIDSGDRRLPVYRGLVGALVDRGRAQEALEAAEGALALFPDDCFLLANRGRVFELSGDFSGAELFYRKALVRNERCRLVSENLGVLLMEEGRLDEAALTFEGAISRPGPPHPLFHLNLGYVYLRRGEKTRAVDQFARYLRLEPRGLDNVPEILRREAAGEAKHP